MSRNISLSALASRAFVVPADGNSMPVRHNPDTIPRGDDPESAVGVAGRYYVSAFLRSGARGALGLPRHRPRPGSRRDVARLADQPIHSGASGSRGRDILPRYLGRTLSPTRTGAVS